LDLNDPETRQYAQSQLDLSDPETKKYWDSLTGNPVPMALGETPEQANPATPSAPNKQGGGVLDYFGDRMTGLQPGTREFFQNAINAAGGTPLGASMRAGATALDLATRGIQGVGAAFEGGANLLDKGAEALGLDEALSVGGNKFLPGSAAMALAEAFPLGGTEAGILPYAPPSMSKAGIKKLANEGQELWNSGATPEQMQAWAAANKLNPLDEAELANAAKAREAGQQAQVVERLQQEAKDFQAAKASSEPTPLEQEAKDFQPKPEPTAEDLFPTAEGRAAREKALEERLSAEAQDFQNRKSVSESEGETPEEPSQPATPPVSDEHINNVVNQINELASGWKNSPDFEVYKTVDDIEDPAIRQAVQREGDGVKGFVGPDGKVRIIASNLKTPDEVKAVVFHEALGHHGLSQMFRDNLDATLTRFYNEGPEFRELVDDWMEENPGAYSNSPNPTARAAEEVLAEMSEQGQIPATLMNRIKNFIKATARKAGIKGVDFSEREIKTILAMAHDAVVNGSPSIAENGFRYSKVWHGSGADFDQFDNSRMGTGEGFQAYGWGSYFTDTKKVAESYKATMGGERPSWKKVEGTHSGTRDNMSVSVRREFPDDPAAAEIVADSMFQMITNNRGKKPTASEVLEDIVGSRDYENMAPEVKSSTMDFMEPVVKYVNDNLDVTTKGKLYEVELPDNAEWLQWDRGYADQPEAVKKALNDMELGPEFEPRMANKTGEDYYRDLVHITGSPRQASKYLSEYGVTGNKYLDGMSRRKGEGSYNYVVFDDKTPQIVNKYSKAKSLTPEKIKTEKNLDDVLDFLGENAVKADARSIPEILREGEDFSLSPSSYAKASGLEEKKLAGRVAGAKQLLTDQVEKLVSLGNKAEQEGMTPSLYADIRQSLAITQAVYGKFQGDIAEIGRAMRVLREVTNSKKSTQAALKFMQEFGESGGVPTDPEALLKFVKNIEAARTGQGAAGASKYIKNASKMHAEDYLDSLIGNTMLSSPATWKANFLGSPIHFIYELGAKGVTSALGQPLRVTNKAMDRVYGREVAARAYGALTMLKNFKTYENTIKAFASGESSKSFNRKVSTSGLTSKRMSNKNPFKYPIAAAETLSRRPMAAIDEFWSTIFHISNLYGEVANDVAKAMPNSHGKEFWDTVAEGVANPKPELVEKAIAETDRLLFRDKPTEYTQRILNWTRPRTRPEMTIKMTRDPETGKMVPTAKTVKSPNTIPERAIKFGARTTVRFMPTLDRIAAAGLRNSGPLSLISKEIRSDLKAGGVRRQSAIGRMAFSSVVLAYFADKAAQGELVFGDPNYKKETALSAVRPKMSIKINGKWQSYYNLDPLSAPMAAAAMAVERAGGKADLTDKDFYLGLTLGMAQALKNSSYAESIGNIIDATSESKESLEKGDFKVGPQLGNLVGGQISTVANPAFVRWINQKYLDPYMRNTRGESGSFGERLGNRIEAGTPMFSKELPERYDVYGRPAPNARQERPEETDPVVQELNRLERSQKEVLVGAPGSNVNDYRTNPQGERVTLGGKDREDYQRLSGTYFLDAMREVMQYPGWQQADDNLKKEAIKEVLDDARKTARAELFGTRQGGDQ